MSLGCPGAFSFASFAPLALAASLFSASLAQAAPRMPTHVACVGDSITQGVGASSGSTNYPANLQKLFGASVKVGNFGHSGATMLSASFGDAPYQNDSEYQAATSFVTGAGGSAVVDVIILLGANDSSSRNWTPSGKPKNDQQYLKDYRAMVEHFTALSPKPVVYLVLPLATGNNCSCGTLCCQISATVIYDEEIPLIKALAAEKKLPTIDLNTPTTGHPEYFNDGIHPNDAGYVVVAQLMKDGLLRVPTVALTAPSAGASLSTVTPVLLSAAASGGTVAIDDVEFFQGLTSLGHATTAPFGVSWPAAAGAYTLTATVTDSTGASATSEAVAVEVVAPTVGTSGSAGAASTAGAASGGASAGGAASGGGGASGSGLAGGAGTDGSVAGGAVGGSSVTTPTAEAGCSCRAAGHRATTSWAGLLTALFGFLAWRRRN